MAKSRKKDVSLFNAILYIVVGVLFIVFKSQMLDWLMTAVGVMFIVMGIISLVRRDTISGLLAIIIGAVILLGGWLFVQIVLIVFGVLLTVRGILLLSATIKPFNLFGVLFAALTIFVGLMLIVAKWVVLDWYYIAVGVMFIVSGVLELFGK